MAFEHTNKKGTKYYLHSTQVTLRGANKKQTIYYFARKIGKNALDMLPAGFQVVENTRTGLPVLKRS